MDLTTKSFLEVTYMDERNNQFLCLGGAGFLSMREGMSQFEVVPKSPRVTKFSLDLKTPDGSLVSDACISGEVAASKLGKSVRQLIRAARARQATASP